MKSRIALSTLCLGVVVVLGSASNASAFGFGRLCGNGPACCDAEPTCCAPEPSCCAEPSCCDPCCAPRGCRILDGLKGLFNRNRCCEPACCEVSCCVAEPTCCAPEPSCCVEPSCEAAPCGDACCDPCCAPRRCRILDGLKGLFNRNRCCEPACGVEVSCCVEPSCGC